MRIEEVFRRVLHGERIQEDRETMRECAVDALRQLNAAIDAGELSPELAWMVKKGCVLAKYVIWLIDNP
jgi:hypothetical protein